MTKQPAPAPARTPNTYIMFQSVFDDLDAIQDGLHLQNSHAALRVAIHKVAKEDRVPSASEVATPGEPIIRHQFRLYDDDLEALTSIAQTLHAADFLDDPNNHSAAIRYAIGRVAKQYKG